MRSIADLLAEHSFFRGLPPETIELIAGCGTNVHFVDDEAIHTEGDPADTFYVLRSGRIAVEIHAPRRGPLVVETIGPGEILGVSWLLPPYRWSFDARAVDPTSAVSIDAACLRAKSDVDPVLGYELYKRFSVLINDRLQATRLQLVDLYGPGGE